MNGLFYKSWRKLPRCLLLMACGSFMAIRFGIWGIDALRTPSVPSSQALFCLPAALFGLLLGGAGIVLLRYNRGAHIEVNESGIQGCIGLGQDISVKRSEIVDVYAHTHHLTVETKTGLTVISDLQNALALAQYLLTVTPTLRLWRTDEAEAMRQAKHHRRKYRRALLGTVFGVLLMFIHIFWCVLLTGGRDISDFSAVEDSIFTVFLTAELLTTLGTFLLARTAGKILIRYQRSQLRVLSIRAYADRQKHLPDGTTDVLYFRHATLRIVIYAQAGGYVYRLQKFDPFYSWINCDTSAQFDNRTALQNEIDRRFEGILLERL